MSSAKNLAIRKHIALVCTFFCVPTLVAPASSGTLDLPKHAVRARQPPLKSPPADESRIVKAGCGLKDSLSTFDSEQTCDRRFPGIGNVTKITGEPVSSRGQAKKSLVAHLVKAHSNQTLQTCRKQEMSPRQERKMKKLRFLVTTQQSSALKQSTSRSHSQEANQADSALGAQDSYDSIVQHCKEVVKKRRKPGDEIKIPIHLIRPVERKYKAAKKFPQAATPTSSVKGPASLELPDDSNYNKMVSFIEDLKGSIETPVNSRKVSKLPTTNGGDTVKSYKVLPSGSLQSSGQRLFTARQPPANELPASQREDVVIMPLSLRFTGEDEEKVFASATPGSQSQLHSGNDKEPTELADKLFVRESWKYNPFCDGNRRPSRQPIQTRQLQQPNRKSQLILVRQMFKPVRGSSPAGQRKEPNIKQPRMSLPESDHVPVKAVSPSEVPIQEKPKDADALDYAAMRENLHIQPGEALNLFPRLCASGIVDGFRMTHCDVLYDDLSIKPLMEAIV